MFKNRFRVFSACVLSVLCLDVSATPAVPWSMTDNCESPRTTTVETSPMIALVAFGTSGKNVVYVEHRRTTTATNVYSLSASSSGGADDLQVMKEVARAAYISGSLVAYCYTTVGNYRIVHGIALVDSN